MSLDTQTHLTADNYTPELLKKVVMETCGLLGVYEIKEYHHLLDVSLALDPPEVDESTGEVIADFEVDFKPFQIDRNAGRVKLRPNSPRAGKLMDQARAQKVMDRNPWLRRFHAIGFVRMIKRTREAVNNTKVQDFLLRNYNNPDLIDLLDDPNRFKAHITAKMRDDFSRQQLNAIHDLLPKVNQVMQRVPYQKGQNDQDTGTSSDDGSQESDDSGSTTSQESSSDEQPTTDSIESNVANFDDVSSTTLKVTNGEQQEEEDARPIG